MGINDEKEIEKIKNKLEDKIKKAEKIYLEIKNNPSAFKIIRTDFAYVKELYKPYITYYSYKDEKHHKDYLRKEVPNVLWDGEIIKPKKPKIKIDKILKEMENPFGGIYIKRLGVDNGAN
jgi:hypothetical protein